MAKVLELQHQAFQRVFSIPLGLTDFISLQSKGLSRVLSSTTVQKRQFFSVQSSLRSNFLICTWLKKPWLWLYGPLLAKRCLCLSNTLSRFVTAFIPRSKHLLISWLQSPVHSDSGVGFLLNQEASWRKKKKKVKKYSKQVRLKLKANLSGWYDKHKIGKYVENVLWRIQSLSPSPPPCICFLIWSHSK